MPGQFPAFLRALLVGAAALLGACGATNPVSGASLAPSTEALNASQEYRLDSGDGLRIAVFGREEFTGTFQVSGEGKILYPLIGEITAKGLTTGELHRTIVEKLKAGYLKQPNVTIEVMTYRPFYILGEVQQPGTYPYATGLTIMNAVATAGGFSYRADSRLVFIRHSNETAERRYQLDGRILVQPGDTVRVPDRLF